MGGKLNIYNLGDLGVHLVESPVHSPDGSFTSAQNAEVSQNEGEHGIRKRFGLSKLTTDALNGAVRSLGLMPFPDPFEPLVVSSSGAIYYNTSTDGNNYSARSTTGAAASWTAVTDIGRWFGVSAPTANQRVYSRGGAINTNGLIYYYSTETPNDGFMSWDGTTRTSVATVTLGANEAVRGMCQFQGEIYLLVTDTTADTAKIYQLVGSSFVDTGATISHEATCISGALGKLWIGTDTNRIYSWEIATGTSTVEHTITPNVGSRAAITSIAHYNGLLYASAGTASGVGTALTEDMVLKRAVAGTWSDITPAASGIYGPLASFDGEIFVARSTNGAFTGCEIRRYDGSSWNTDLDVTTQIANTRQAMSLVVWNSNLYVVTSGTGNNGLVRRNTSGTWSTVVDLSGSSQEVPQGGMGFY